MSKLTLLSQPIALGTNNQVEKLAISKRALDVAFLDYKKMGRVNYE